MIKSSTSARQKNGISWNLIAICGTVAGFVLGANIDFRAEAQMSMSGMPGPANESPFLAENAAAMDKMMADMAVKPTGDVDCDFVEMMVPHHQGAIDMAKAFSRYGHNEQLRRLAQEIVVTQQQEIVTMRLALGEPLPPSSAPPTQPQIPPAAGSSAPMSHDSMTRK